MTVAGQSPSFWNPAWTWPTGHRPCQGRTGQLHQIGSSASGHKGKPAMKVLIRCSSLMAVAVLLAGCASTPEQRQAEEKKREERREADEHRKITEQQRKAEQE